MNAFKRLIVKTVQKIVLRVSGGELMQDSTEAVGDRYKTPGLAELIRSSSAQGIVLLKNDGALPLDRAKPVSIFGRCRYDYFYVGYGSGGDVNAPYKVSLSQAVKSRGYACNTELDGIYDCWRSKPENKPNEGWWGNWPMSYEEMPLTSQQVDAAAKVSDTAVVVIGRAAGEDRENTLKKGSYYLTDCEKKNLDKITAAFKKTVVVLDCGNIIDMSWVIEYGERLSAVVYAWQGGQESGNSLADVLWGEVNPCGKLPDTIAKTYSDYPSSHSFGARKYNCYTEDVYVGYRYFETFARDKVLYPFGFGLSYTDFGIDCLSFSRSGDSFTCMARVTNNGNCAGREVVQLYAACPCGKLGKAAKSLVAFAKTDEIAPGMSEEVTLSFDLYDFSSFDDCGKTGNKGCYVVEQGRYSFVLGNCVTADNTVFDFTQDETRVLVRHDEICGVKNSFERLCSNDGKPCYEKVGLGGERLAERILAALPEQIGFSGDRGYKLADVKAGKVTLEQFIAQLTDEELEALSRGEGTMNSALGTSGNAGAYAGVTESLRAKGVPPIITTDGPAGIRLNKYCALLPCGTALAATWDTELVTQLYSKVGEEMRHYGSDILLGPGMNIHRNPLCGRNFEYFSEDPLLSGSIACAFVVGVQSNGVGACPKHFACNNQEVNRNYNDSRVSERALREIYLKGFEICVKRSRPLNIMTSYNKINGVWSHYNYDLAKTVLRDEWGYDGVVITDWWMRKSKSPEFPLIRDNAYRVRACVNVLMPGNMSRAGNGYISDGTLNETLGKPGGITRSESEQSAKVVLSLAMKLEHLSTQGK